jgi:FlaA1/EpsC-like NDP-sugar epimerase
MNIKNKYIWITGSGAFIGEEFVQMVLGSCVNRSCPIIISRDKLKRSKMANQYANNRHTNVPESKSLHSLAIGTTTQEAIACAW